MSNSAPLINLAILQTLKSSEYQDEIDLFIPYVAISIRNLRETPFSGRDIKEQMRIDFGVVVPADVVDILLARAKKRKIVKVENNMYFPLREKIDSWTAQYDANSFDIERSMAVVAENFVFFSRDRFKKEISKEQAIRLIYEYLVENISESAVIANNGENISDKIKNKNHLTASYITHIHKDNKALWPSFEMITRAVMLANYLTFANRISPKSKYNNVTLYLDTPILLGLLGYSGDAKQQALKEVLDLLRNFDLDLATFYETQREVEGILSAWSADLVARNYSKFNPKTLEVLRHKKIDSIEIETRIILLEKNITDLGIRIKKGFRFKAEHNCDVSELENKIKREFRGKWVDPTHDADAISKIHNAREGSEPRSLNEKFSIFITPNSALASISREFFNLSDRCIPYVASEKWLATMFWFKHPGIFTDLPERLLLTTAYGTMYSDNGFWRKFSGRLDALHKQGQISEEDFVLVRYDSDLLLRVHEVSVDKGMNYSDEDVFDVVSGVKEKLLSEKELEIKRIKEVADSEIIKLRSNVANKDGEITATKNRIMKFSSVAALLASFSFCFILIICVFWVSYNNLPIDSVNNSFLQNNKKSALTVAALFITTVLGFAGTFFGINLISVYRWIKSKVTVLLYEFLLGK